MYLGKEIKKKIEDAVGNMTADTMDFDVDGMKFLIVKEGSKEEQKQRALGLVDVIPPYEYNNEKYFVFNM